MLNVKLSLLSKTAVEYFPLSIVISMIVLWDILRAEALEDICHQLRYQMQGLFNVSKSSIYLIMLLIF